jgi:hypothetical protein
MKKAPEGALHNTKCPHSEAKKPLNRENTCPRWDSNQPLPLKVRHSLENIPTPAQSEASTTESEAQGVDTVHTLFCEHFEPQPIRVRRSFCGCCESLSTTSRRAVQLRRDDVPGSAGTRLTKWAEQ